MKSYIQLTKSDGSDLLVPLGKFFATNNSKFVSVRFIGDSFAHDVKESISEIIQKIEDAEAEYENLSYVGPEK